MCRVQATGVVVSITDVRVCERTGFAKRNVVLQEGTGNKIAPEFHPKNFQLLSGVQTGDVISVSCRVKMNKNASANFLVVDEMTKE